MPNIGAAPRICWLLLVYKSDDRKVSHVLRKYGFMRQMKEGLSEFERSWVLLMYYWLASETLLRFRLRIGNGRYAVCFLSGATGYDSN